jgi:endonuclease III
MVDVQRVLALLETRYVLPEWKPNGDPLGTLIQTILSQNTSDINSGRAFAFLKNAFPHWEDLIEALVDVIAGYIKSGGLANIKAARIQETLVKIKSQRGSLDLDFLAGMPLEKARDWLKQLPGVGDKTAGIVLLFALGRPALPVDTHVYRVSQRLGLIKKKASLEQAHRRLESLVSAEDRFRYHVLFIQHGRRTCKALRPLCPDCVLKELCPSFRFFYPKMAKESVRA